MPTTFEFKALISLLLVTLLQMLIGCGNGAKGPSRQSSDTIGLERIFSILEADEVAAFRYQDWCKVIDYRKGCYANPNEPNCIHVARNTPSPFTTSSESDLNRIWKGVEWSQAGVHTINEIKYDRSGNLVYGIFDCSEGFNRQRYVFDPGYILPSNVNGELWFAKINVNWYFVVEDWN